MTSTQHETAIWSWRPELGSQLLRKVRVTALAVVAVVAVTTAIAIATPTRFVIVVAFLIGGVGVLWLTEHRRFRATEVTLDQAGVLRVDDGRKSSSIDLSSADTVRVRLNTQAGVSVLSPNPKWTIEIAGPDASLAHAIAHAAGLFNPDTADVERLETELVTHAERLSGRRVVRTQHPIAPTSMLADPRDPAFRSPERGETAETASEMGRFEWQPPASPNAARRRRWFRIGYIGVAVLVAILGAVAALGDPVGIVLSVLTVPGIIVAICGGLDWALGRARRFRLVVENGVLRVDGVRTPKEVDLNGATVALGRSSEVVATGTTTTRTSRWFLTVEAADDTVLVQMMPSFGTTTTEADYVALERELARRT